MQLTERLINLVEIKVLQNKPQNCVNFFHIINNESESSEFSLIQTFPDTSIITHFSNTKLNAKDKFSDPAENNNHMYDNKV